MGGADNIYPLSGGSHLVDGHDADSDSEFRIQPSDLSETLRNGLCYSEDDVESSRLLVLLSYYKQDEDNYEVVDFFSVGTLTAPWPESTPDNVMAIFNVIPGDMPDMGGYCDKDDVDISYTLSPGSSTVGVTHDSYMIAQQVSPKLEPHILHKILRLNTLKLDYGGLKNIIDQYVDWAAIHSAADVYSYDAIEHWYDLLIGGNKTDEERLHDAWKGPGMMWTMVNPARFPIPETLDELTNKTSTTKPHRIAFLPLELILEVFGYLHPKDVRALLSTSRSTRFALSTFADRFALDLITNHEPWYLPAGPFDFEGGTKENDWWYEQWSKKGLISDEVDEEDPVINIPWLNYRHACSHSMSMWNRKRIWKVAEQVYAVAIDMNLITEEDA